jgi:hypothetical protein
VPPSVLQIILEQEFFGWSKMGFAMFSGLFFFAFLEGLFDYVLLSLSDFVSMCLSNYVHYLFTFVICMTLNLFFE